jgi:hypothetical protein
LGTKINNLLQCQKAIEYLKLCGSSCFARLKLAYGVQEFSAGAKGNYKPAVFHPLHHS